MTKTKIDSIISPKTQLLVTTNYDLFEMRPLNRSVKDTRKKSLISSIDRMDLTDCKPIIVNENMEIIDGQGRFTACKELGLPIYYIKKNLNGNSDKAMIRLNVNQVNWTLNEYIEFYARQGKAVYKEVFECKEKYGITLTTSVCFVANASHAISKTIQMGKLKRGRLHYSVYGNILNDFKQIFKDYNHTYFIRALIYVVNLKFYNHKSDFKRFVKNRYDLIGCSTTQQYLKMFEQILNSYRRGTKVNILAEYSKVKK